MLIKGRYLKLYSARYLNEFDTGAALGCQAFLAEDAVKAGYIWVPWVTLQML
jgi:hypothetical protein